jgi:hypothetical protein
MLSCFGGCRDPGVGRDDDATFALRLPLPPTQGTCASLQFNWEERSGLDLLW